ncbi:MAG TPA: glucose 1-dehydrogenase [Methylomirabilota bacterium]|jgi:3-oxoacyl-[acyl-carrier protein] reductase|nr:glucose 1-dehydrogenase [Methylomirabilota bacterium]
MLLRDKVAVVTGSGRGIGRGIALRFAREGARVVVNDRDDGAVAFTANEIRQAGGTCLGVTADVSVESEVRRLFDDTLRAFGTLDILVNNAQMLVNQGESGPFLKMTSSGWDAYVRANMGMLFYCTHQAARIMVRRGVRGSIINISSNGANRVHRNQIAYDSVKGAIDTFTRAVGVDLAPWGIRCNAIRPGMIAVDYWEALAPEEKARRIRAIPIGREGRPADVAWAAVFLAADDAGFVTGQNFEVDGGMLAPGRSAPAELGPVAGPENIGDF